MIILSFHPVHASLSKYEGESKVVFLYFGSIYIFAAYILPDRGARGVIVIVGGARGVIVIIVGNEHGDTSSNPGRD